MKDMKIGRWDATHLLHDASLDSSVNEAFLQHRYIMTWDKCGGSCFTHYTTDVATNYKTIFFAERGNCTRRYMLELIPLSATRTIASMVHNLMYNLILLIHCVDDILFKGKLEHDWMVLKWKMRLRFDIEDR